MKTIMDASAIQRAITRITYEILERNHGADQLAVIGIYSRGVILADASIMVFKVGVPPSCQWIFAHKKTLPHPWTSQRAFPANGCNEG